MPKPLSDQPTFSPKDVVEAYKNYDASDEAKEAVIYFVSELTGMSVDAISEYTEGDAP